MSAATLTERITMTMNGQRYVVIPEEEYIAALDAANTVPPEELTDEDRELIRRSHEALEEPGIPYEEARKEWGLE